MADTPYSFRRLCLIPVIMAVDARKNWKWMTGQTDNEQDLGRARNWMGWFDPRMAEHWDRLDNPDHPDYGSWTHSASNVSAERARIDPQRTAKSAGWWFTVSACLLALWLLTAAALGVTLTRLWGLW